MAVLNPSSWSAPPAGLSLSAGEAEHYPVLAYCVVLGLLFHGLYVPLFLALSVPVLAAFNVLSVLTFVLAAVLCRRGHLRAALAAMSIEVAAHGWLGCLLLGWASGLHYPMLILVPLVFLSEGGTLLVKAAIGTGMLVLYGACYLASPDVGSGLVPLSGLTALNMVVVFFGLIGTSAVHTATVHRSRLAHLAEYERAESILHNVLPETIAVRLKAEEVNIADAFSACSVLFADIVGFTPLSAKIEAAELVEVLDGIFTAFDGFTETLGIEKIKTIGDSYMVAAGIPEPLADHADRAAEMALCIQTHIAGLEPIHGVKVQVRIGIHSGPAIAGVIGRKKFIYDLWGDTVNTAARMESHGIPGAIQITTATRTLLADRYTFEERGVVTVKGKGEMRTWLLTGRR
ncbi:MAG: adenylate cyclase [Myxococcota bacterium]